MDSATDLEARVPQPGRGVYKLTNTGRIPATNVRLLFNEPRPKLTQIGGTVGNRSSARVRDLRRDQRTRTALPPHRRSGRTERSPNVVPLAPG